MLLRAHRLPEVQVEGKMFEKCVTSGARLATRINNKYKLILSMFHAVRQVNIYSNKCTVIRYNNIRTCGKTPTCFGIFRPSSRRYATKKDKIKPTIMYTIVFFFAEYLTEEGQRRRKKGEEGRRRTK